MLGEESQGQALDLRSAQKWVEKRLLQTYADEDPSWHNIVVEEGSGLSRNNCLSRWAEPYQSPNTSCISYWPDCWFINQLDALIAPKAKVILLDALWVISTR